MSQDIFLSLIDPDPEQPRKHFQDVDDLAQSIDANGLAVPILVRPMGERFTIVHGERRYRAALSLGWETIRAEVRDISPDEARWLSLVENVQRADLTPIEEARAYQARLASGITQTELGRRIGKSQSYVAQKLRLLKLSADVRDAVHLGNLTEGHARQLLRLKEEKDQERISRFAIEDSWPVAQLRRHVDEWLFVDEAMPVAVELQEQLKQAKTIEDALHIHEQAMEWEQRAKEFCPNLFNDDDSPTLSAMFELTRREAVIAKARIENPDLLEEIEFWSKAKVEIVALKELLNDADTIEKCVHVQKRAASLQKKVAERNIELERKIGQTLTEMEVKNERN